MPAGLTAGKSPILCLQEKPLGRIRVPVPITDTGGQVEHTEVSELTLVKELGKIVPLLREKGRPGRVNSIRREPEGAAVKWSIRLFTNNTGLS